MLNESPPGCVYARQRVCGVSRVIRLLATTLQESTLVSRVVVAVVPNAASRRESSRRHRRTRRRALCPGRARSHSEWRLALTGLDRGKACSDLLVGRQARRAWCPWPLPTFSSFFLESCVRVNRLDAITHVFCMTSRRRWVQQEFICDRKQAVGRAKHLTPWVGPWGVFHCSAADQQQAPAMAGAKRQL